MSATAADEPAEQMAAKRKYLLDVGKELLKNDYVQTSIDLIDAPVMEGTDGHDDGTKKTDKVTKGGDSAEAETLGGRLVNHAGVPLSTFLKKLVLSEANEILQPVGINHHTVQTDANVFKALVDYVGDELKSKRSLGHEDADTKLLNFSWNFVVCKFYVEKNAGSNARDAKIDAPAMGATQEFLLNHTTSHRVNTKWFFRFPNYAGEPEEWKDQGKYEEKYAIIDGLHRISALGAVNAFQHNADSELVLDDLISDRKVHIQVLEPLQGEEGKSYQDLKESFCYACRQQSLSEMNKSKTTTHNTLDDILRCGLEKRISTFTGSKPGSKPGSEPEISVKLMEEVTNMSRSLQSEAAQNNEVEIKNETGRKLSSSFWKLCDNLLKTSTGAKSQSREYIPALNVPLEGKNNQTETKCCHIAATLMACIIAYQPLGEDIGQKIQKYGQGVPKHTYCECCKMKCII